MGKNEKASLGSENGGFSNFAITKLYRLFGDILVYGDTGCAALLRINPDNRRAIFARSIGAVIESLGGDESFDRLDEFPGFLAKGRVLDAHEAEAFLRGIKGMGIDL